MNDWLKVYHVYKMSVRFLFSTLILVQKTPFIFFMHVAYVMLCFKNDPCCTCVLQMLHTYHGYCFIVVKWYPYELTVILLHEWLTCIILYKLEVRLMFYPWDMTLTPDACLFLFCTYSHIWIPVLQLCVRTSWTLSGDAVGYLSLAIVITVPS